MSQTVTIKDAASRLADLIFSLQPGDEITVTSGDQPVAKIVPADTAQPIRRRRAGAGKGMLHIIKEDEEHLEDFKDYM